MIFSGDFDLLPVRAHLDYGPVPFMPTTRDFDDAMTLAITADPFTVEGAAAVWHGEAVRWRRGPGHGMPLDSKCIAQATAHRLRTMQDDALAADGCEGRVVHAHRLARASLGGGLARVP